MGQVEVGRKANTFSGELFSCIIGFLELGPLYLFIATPIAVPRPLFQASSCTLFEAFTSTLRLASVGRTSGIGLSPVKDLLQTPCETFFSVSVPWWWLCPSCPASKILSSASKHRQHAVKRWQFSSDQAVVAASRLPPNKENQ